MSEEGFPGGGDVHSELLLTVQQFATRIRELLEGESGNTSVTM